MALSLIGCGDEQTHADSPAQDGNTPTGKVLTYSVVIDMPTLDQSMVNSVESMTLTSHIQEGLVRLHDGKVTPGLAKEWEVSKDGLVYTFHLRDAKWSDGVDVTAYDFEYAIKRLVDPATASPYSFIAEPIKNAMEVNSGELGVEETGVKALDEKTLEITLEVPAPYFLGMLNMPHFFGVRKDLVEKYGQDFAADPEKNVYCGPFVLEEWKHEDRLVLAKNQNYWNKDKVNLDKVNIIVVSDPNTALSMYENGDLDFVDVPSNLVEQYMDKAQLYYNGADDFLKLNMDGKSPLKNKNLRLAINYAVDREDYINITTSGLYDAGTRYVLPVVAGVDKKYGEEYPYEAFPLKADAETAKEYLNKAMAELGVSSPKEIKLELLTTDTDVSRTQAEVLQDQIQRNLGIVIDIKQVPYKQRLQMETNREFQMVFSGWAPDYDDPYTYLGLWITSSPYNQISYSNKKYDELLEFSSTCRDPRERMNAFIVCDEPISALDVSIQAQVVNMLLRFQRDMSLTYLFIAHDLSMVRYVSDRVAVMYVGNIVEYADAAELYKNPVHPYTKALLSSIPVADPKLQASRKRIVLQGDVPSPVNPPDCCKFVDRCRYCKQVCKEIRPALKEVSSQHFAACHLY